MTSYMMTQISWVPGWYASAMTSLFSLRHGISPLTFFHKICWVTYRYPFPICTPQIIQNENLLLCKNTHSIQLTCRTIVQQKVWTGSRLEYHSTTWCKIEYTIIWIMMTSSNGKISVSLAALQRPVTQSFDVSFDLRLNKRLSKQSRRRWFETPYRSLWRHCNEWKQNLFASRYI